MFRLFEPMEVSCGGTADCEEDDCGDEGGRGLPYLTTILLKRALAWRVKGVRGIACEMPSLWQEVSRN